MFNTFMPNRANTTLIRISVREGTAYIQNKKKGTIYNKNKNKNKNINQNKNTDKKYSIVLSV